MKETLTPIILKGEAPYSERIYSNFCTLCKYKKYIKGLATYPCFVSCNGVCVRFEYSLDKVREECEQEILESQATTIWLEKGKTVEELKTMPKKELMSVLSKKHYAQIEKRYQEDKKNLELIIRKSNQSEIEKEVTKCSTGKRGRPKNGEKNI